MSTKATGGIAVAYASPMDGAARMTKYDRRMEEHAKLMAEHAAAKCERRGHLWVPYPFRSLNVREWCARCKRWRDL